jgi:hypothetical protein
MKVMEDATMSQRSQPARRPLSRRIQRRVFRVLNVFMRRVLGLPFATPLSARLMLLHLTGRRTGRSYRQPVSYVRDGDLLLTPGGGSWTLNLVDGQPVTAILRGHRQALRPEIVRDPASVGRLLEIMTRANPMVSRFVGMRREPGGHLDAAALNRAIEHGFVVVRWRAARAGRQGEPPRPGEPTCGCRRPHRRRSTGSSAG